MRTIDSRVDAVKIYRRGATVTRTADLVFDGGPLEQIELPMLPLSLLDPTVRVAVVDVEPADAVLVATDARVALFLKPRDEVVEAPDRRELESVERELDRRRRALAHVEAEIQLLAGMRAPDRPRGEPGKAPPPAPLQPRLALEQFTDEATRARSLERRQLLIEIEKLEEELLRLQDRLRRASSAEEVKADEIAKSVVVRLKNEGAPVARARLELEYTVPGARWAPAYQFRLSRDGRAAEIAMRAFVAQRTGEDWRGVRMTLSTASPLSFTELPELSSLRIGRAQADAPRRTGFRAPPEGAGALFRDFDRDRARALQLVPPLLPWQAPQLPAPRPAATATTLLGARPKPAPPPAAPRAPPPRARAAPAASSDEPTGEGLALGEAMESAMLDEAADLMDDDGESYEMTRAAPAAAMPAMKSAGARPARRSAPGGAPDDDVLLAVVYPLLRLGAPGDASARGRLTPLDVRAAYAESLARFGRAVRLDVLSVVDAAEREAQSVASQPLPDGSVDVSELTTHFDFAYPADDPVDIPGDGGFHSVALGVRAAEARTTYVVVPREDTAVYRIVNLQNPTGSPLLPGPAEVSVGGEYVLTTKLPAVPSRGELKLGLGVEQAIKCARNARYEELRSGAKVVAMSELVHEIEIDLVNNLPREIECEVRERVPVPAKGAEVVAEEGPVDPPWEPYDQSERQQPIEGGRRWRVTVDAGAARKLRARYVVKIYANNELVGGNRREA